MKVSKSLKKKRILVTGASGFLGGHLVKKLRALGYSNLSTPSSKIYDLRVLKNCQKAVAGMDIVIHLAARVGGIGLNREKPAEMFYDNIIMGTQLYHEAWKTRGEKFIAIGTICCYPKFIPLPFKEENLWDGNPEKA